MSMYPGRVPFSEDEVFTPLRPPKTYPFTSTLSASAQEFVPRPHHEQQQKIFNSNSESYQVQQQPNVSHQHQPFVQQEHPQQQYQQQSYKHQNGFQHIGQQQRHPNTFFQQPQNLQPFSHQQRQQQQQQQINNVASDIQNRLVLNGSVSGGGGGNAIGGVAAYNKSGGNNYMGNQNRSKIINPAQSQQVRLQKHQQYQQNQQQQQHQRHYQNHTHQQQHQNPTTSSSVSNDINDYESNESDVETIALNYLATVIQCLNHNPGQFDSLATRFLDIFEVMENNQNVLSIAMEDIFNESIQNSNFRYMGAKLYNLLHMLNTKSDSLFLTLLKCKLDYHQNEVLKNIEQNEHGKVRETALFLAELYMQLRGDESRIQLLADNIVFSMKQLLGNESTENIRCICLTLKLAGYDLSMDCKADILEIIQALTNINEQFPNKYPIIGSVLTLQKENWGRKLSSSLSQSESIEGASSPAPLRISDEPIFYGPDGRELTVEEADFMSGAVGYVDEDDEGDDDYYDFEMDAEAAKAYREFCKSNISKS